MMEYGGRELDKLLYRDFDSGFTVSQDVQIKKKKLNKKEGDEVVAEIKRNIINMLGEKMNMADINVDKGCSNQNYFKRARQEMTAEGYLFQKYDKQGKKVAAIYGFGYYKVKYVGVEK